MRTFARFVVGLVVASVCSLGCTSIIGLKVPPQQDASATNEGPDATMEAGMQPPNAEAGVGTETSVGEAANPNGSALGVACGANGDCQSGFCTDGVCCDNACSGMCEKCNLAPSIGTCSPIPANTDPDMECITVVSDAGAASLGDASPAAPDASDGGPTSNGGGDGAADASGNPVGDAGTGDGGDAGSAVINFPDGGYTSNNMTCSGSCDGKGGKGKGSCTYPDGTKTCGTQFCNESNQSAGFVCDGNGSCTLGFTSCTAYACANGACGKTCTVDSQCVAGFYCNAGTCAPTLGTGQACTLPSECASGFCTRGVGGGPGALVCCETACTIPGGNCVKTAMLQGKCECNVTCPTGGSCQVYYQDLDGDGYGNKDGDPTGGITAYVGCSNVAPKAGYVADNTDCDDQDPNAHPGQTAYFGVPGRVNYDYDCSGAQDKQTPEFPGQSCKFCNATPTCGATDATCTATGAQAALGCGPRFQFLCPPCKPPLFCPCRATYGGCYPNTTTGFTQTVACGTLAETTTCGTCGAVSEASGTGTANTFTTNVRQLCH